MSEFTIQSSVRVDSNQAREELARIRKEYEELRQRMLQPIPVSVSSVSGSPAGPGSASGGASAWNATAAALSATGNAASVLYSGVRVAWGGVKALMGGVAGLFASVGRGIMYVATSPIGMLRTAVGGLTGAFSLMRRAAQSAVSVLTPAADLQQRSINMQVLLKDPGKAKRRLEELERYAKATNYNPGEVIEASNLMQAFGIHGNDLTRLKLAGDAANAFGKDIREVVTSLNYLGSGRGGEAFESLARIGVTRDKLKPYGVQFSKQGVLLTDTKTALKAVFKYFEDNFGGATKRQAKTWKGALQQAAGEVTYALSHGLSSALRPATDFVRNSVIPSISRIGASLGKVKWDKLLRGPLDTLGKLVNTASTIAGRFIDPGTRGGMAGEFRTLGSSLLDAGRLLADGLLGVGQGLLQDLGATLERFAKNGVFPSLMATFWNMGKTVLFGFLDAGRLVLSGFSDRFKSDMLMALDRIGINTGETEARKSTEKTAKASILADIANGHLGKELQLFYREQERGLKGGELPRQKKAAQRYMMKRLYTTEEQAKNIAMASHGYAPKVGWRNDTIKRIYEQIGQAQSEKEIDTLLDRIDAGVESSSVINGAKAAVNAAHTGNQEHVMWEALGGTSNPLLKKAYEEKYAGLMGWSGGSETGIEFKTGAALDDLKKSLSETVGKIGDSVTLEHTREAGGRLADSFRDAGGRLQDFYNEQRRQAALRSGYTQADDRAGRRINAIDKQIEEKKNESLREKGRIRSGSGSYDTLNGIEFSIGDLQNERRRVEAWRKGNEKRYEQASNAVSLRWRRDRADRDISILQSRADGLRGTDPSGYAAIQRRIAEKTAQRDTIVGQQTLMANAVKVKAIDRDIGKLRSSAEGVRESDPRQHDAIQKRIQVLEQQKALIKEESSNIRMQMQQRQPQQQQMQQRQQQPQRPVSPGVIKGVDAPDKAAKAAFARIASNTGRTVDNMFAISRGVNGIISQNAQICKVLQQILAEA